jgi:hypothetical protein
VVRHVRDSHQFDDLARAQVGLAVVEEEILAAISRLPPAFEFKTTVASSAIRHGGMSPIGDALPTLPQMVPRFRIWRDPMRRIIAAIDG